MGEKIAQDRFGLQSNAFALPCNMALPSAQDRLGLQSKAFALRCNMALPSAQDRLEQHLVLCS